METYSIQHELSRGLFEWYPFEENSRKVDYNDLKCYQNDRFDYILSVADLEKTLNPQLFFEKCKLQLSSGGRLLLAVNNRFGIRYFCGDRDPYTDRNFDGIENYSRAYSKPCDIFSGRCYSRAEIEKLLLKNGIKKYRFYSVFSDLKNPMLIFAEDYLPNEDISGRIIPTYNFPDTVFLEETALYNSLIENGMFHQMANAYIVECALDGNLSDVMQATCSVERGRENAMFTVLYGNGKAIKKPVYKEGEGRIQNLAENMELMAEQGISVVKGSLQNGKYVMPYINAEIGQVYLKRLFYEDFDKFLSELDNFRDIIIKSSEVVEENDDGMILKHAYWDMIPLNSFHIGDEFVFFDQEFRMDNYPANVIIWRMIASFYSGDTKANQVYPINLLFDRYHLNDNLDKWSRMSQEFLVELRKERELLSYHNKIRVNHSIINSNRQRMNYSEEDYERLFVNIFDRADTRKLIIFGSGLFAEKFIAMYSSNYPIYCIIDNNSAKWGEKLKGIDIQSPDVIKNFSSGEYKVIICIKNYLSVMKQLDEMGVTEYSIYDSGKSYENKAIQINTDIKKNSVECKKYHVGYVAGVFDMFHMGHLNLIRKAKELCDYLIVGVVSDEGVYKLKNKKPIISGVERVEILRACRYVDQAQLLPEEYSGIEDAYNMFHFDCQFSGDDHTEDDSWKTARDFLKRHGADLVFFKYTEGVSSTSLRKQMKEGI